MSERNADIKAAIDSFDLETARKLLRDSLPEADAETYYLASKVALDDEQKEEFLKKAIELDPFHEAARKALKPVSPPPSPPPPPRAAPPPAQLVYSPPPAQRADVYTQQRSSRPPKDSPNYVVLALAGAFIYVLITTVLAFIVGLNAVDVGAVGLIGAFGELLATALIARVIINHFDSIPGNTAFIAGVFAGASSFVLSLLGIQIDNVFLAFGVTTAVTGFATALAFSKFIGQDVGQPRLDIGHVLTYAIVMGVLAAAALGILNSLDFRGQDLTTRLIIASFIPAVIIGAGGAVTMSALLNNVSQRL